MKLPRLIAAGLLAATFLPATPAAAEAEHPAKPMLWKVEGKGLAKPSWLFGTIHVGKGPVGILHPAAADALDASGAVYTEVPMDMATQLGLARHFIRSDGQTLTASIGEGLSKQLDAELAAIQPELDSAVFQSLKTWTVAVTVPMLKLQLAGGQPLDAVIWQLGEKKGKTLGSLEKPEDQFSIFDDLPEDEQVLLLAESLKLQKKARETGKDPVDDLVTAYLSGDEKQIETQMELQFTEMAKGEHKELGEKLLKKLLPDRNLTMAAAIAAKLAAEPDRSHFFAVGTGHYVGTENIGELLRKKGYTVTRITE